MHQAFDVAGGEQTAIAEERVKTDGCGETRQVAERDAGGLARRLAEAYGHLPSTQRAVSRSGAAAGTTTAS